jgi:hypothetical protein
MKATINHQQVKGFLGQDIGHGNRWLFVEDKQTRKSYPVALVDGLTGQIIKIEPQETTCGFPTQQLATSLIAAATA